MKPIYVFYHFFAQPNNWIWILDQQLKLVKESGLSLNSNFYMCITGDVDLNYIKIRYPFVNIIDIRSTNEPNIFEGQTLQYIHECVQRLEVLDDARILYMHSKGSHSNSTYVSTWRDVLNHEMITKWEHCYNLLDQYDVVGISDTHVIRSNSVITSGNFWWAKVKYLRTLPSPIDSTQYLDKHHPNDPDYRYCFERWITTNNPKLYFSFNMNVDPYLEYCFIDS